MRIFDRARNARGQVLAIVIALLLIVSTLVPLMVFFSQREAIWTAKEAQSTAAFHLAEAGVEKGFLEISLSTLTWVNLQKGTLITDYQFDKKYTDLAGGTYAISITSGPKSQQATIIAVGRDKLNRQTRAVKAVYGNLTMGGIAVIGVSGVDISGNNIQVEWGGIVSPNSVTARSGMLHPSLWSANNIVNMDLNGSAWPNCDQPNCWFWHSYYAGIPPTPVLDFNFYKSSAIASGTGPCGKYYRCSTCTISGACSDSSGNPYYVEGSWSGFNGPITGSVIVMGDVNTVTGAMTGSNINAAIPQDAWKQYCNDWTFYRTTFEPTNPYTTQCPGLYSSYLSPSTLTYAISPAVNGLLYVGGNFTGPNGGGSTDIAYGVIIVKGNVSVNSNSHSHYYYNAQAAQALQTTQLVLSRLSWQDVLYPWPAGLP